MPSYIERRLNDLNLMPEYIKSPKCKAAFNKLELLCDKLALDARQRRLMKRTLTPFLVPPGVKAAIRGTVFNKYIAKLLQRAHLPGTLEFEKTHSAVSERPDWILRHNGTTVIGYNQLDLWNGGAQLNRASKYLADEDLHKRLARQKIRIICVVAREFKGASKASNLVQIGVSRKRLVWPKDLICSLHI